MNEYEQIPETYEADNEEFNALYVAAWILIIKALMRLVSLPPALNTAISTNTNVNHSTEWLKLERQVNTEVKAIFSNLERKAVTMATDKVKHAYTEGVSFSRAADSQDSKLSEVKAKALNDAHKTRLNKLITQTQDDLLKATTNTQNNIKQLVRTVVSKEISAAGKGGKIGKQSNMAKRIEANLRKQFLNNGINNADVAIIDAAKRKWKLRTYSNMVARTKMNNAYIDAIREESLQNGTDLAIISTKPNTHDACKNYEGMVISLNGLSSGYLTYEGIKKTKQCFHPNCGHFVRPIGNINRVPKNQMKIHESKMKDYKQSVN